MRRPLVDVCSGLTVAEIHLQMFLFAILQFLQVQFLAKQIDWVTNFWMGQQRLCLQRWLLVLGCLRCYIYTQPVSVLWVPQGQDRCPVSLLHNNCHVSVPDGWKCRQKRQRSHLQNSVIVKRLLRRQNQTLIVGLWYFHFCTSPSMIWFMWIYSGQTCALSTKPWKCHSNPQCSTILMQMRRS